MIVVQGWRNCVALRFVSPGVQIGVAIRGAEDFIVVDSRFQGRQEKFKGGDQVRVLNQRRPSRQPYSLVPCTSI